MRPRVLGLFIIQLPQGMCGFSYFVEWDKAQMGRVTPKDAQLQRGQLWALAAPTVKSLDQMALDEREDLPGGNPPKNIKF